jgi:hypothetical protein
VAAELPLEQGLREMASIGAQSFVWLFLAAATVAAAIGAAIIVWALRPAPAYSSEAIAAGSPFDVTFRIENTSPWFPMSRLRLSCVLAYPGAPDLPPTRAADIRELGPGEAASFKCPFPAALKGAPADEVAVATRSEISFRSEFDLPVLGWFRLGDERGPFVLNTRILPPRWTAKPDR